MPKLSCFPVAIGLTYPFSCRILEWVRKRKEQTISLPRHLTRDTVQLLCQKGQVLSEVDPILGVNLTICDAQKKGPCFLHSMRTTIVQGILKSHRRFPTINIASDVIFVTVYAQALVPLGERSVIFTDFHPHRTNYTAGYHTTEVTL